MLPAALCHGPASARSSKRPWRRPAAPRPFGDDGRVDELELEDVASELLPSREELVLLARLWRTAGMVVRGDESRSGNHDDRPITLYLSFEPDERDRLGPHLRVVVSQLAGAILERDASRRWAWRERILLLLDEFPVLGAIREIEQGLAYFRGYGATFLVVVQYLGQLIQAFGREEAISPNCAVQVAFAPTDLATAERLSNLSGRQTIEIDQVSRSSGGLGSGRGGTSKQTVLQGRSLLDASEFRRLGRDQAVVFMPGLPPLVVRKKPYFADPALFRSTEEMPYHEPPGEGGNRAPAAGPADRDSSRERGWERDNEGREMERSHGGL